MNQTVYVDDFATAEDLKSLGFSDKQSKGLVRAIHNSTAFNLATKEDLARLETRLTNRILSIVGLQTAFITIILGLLKFWH